MFKREEIENKEKYVYILKTGPAVAIFKGARLSFQIQTKYVFKTGPAVAI